MKAKRTPCCRSFGGHHWPGGKGQLSEKLAGKPSSKVHATDVIWEFFQNHLKK